MDGVIYNEGFWWLIWDMWLFVKFGKKVFVWVSGDLDYLVFCVVSGEYVRKKVYKQKVL